jgi:hypothetical protein
MVNVLLKPGICNNRFRYYSKEYIYLNIGIDKGGIYFRSRCKHLGFYKSYCMFDNMEMGFGIFFTFSGIYSE